MCPILPLERHEVRCKGITDMHGYFIKDGIRVNMEYDSMIGNWLEYKNSGSEADLNRVREWAQLIWDHLQ